MSNFYVLEHYRDILKINEFYCKIYFILIHTTIFLYIYSNSLKYVIMNDPIFMFENVVITILVYYLGFIIVHIKFHTFMNHHKLPTNYTERLGFFFAYHHHYTDIHMYSEYKYIYMLVQSLHTLPLLFSIRKKLCVFTTIWLLSILEAYTHQYYHSENNNGNLLIIIAKKMGIINRKTHKKHHYHDRQFKKNSINNMSNKKMHIVQWLDVSFPIISPLYEYIGNKLYILLNKCQYKTARIYVNFLLWLTMLIYFVLINTTNSIFKFYKNYMEYLGCRYIFNVFLPFFISINI